LNITKDIVRNIYVNKFGRVQWCKNANDVITVAVNWASMEDYANEMGVVNSPEVLFLYPGATAVRVRNDAGGTGGDGIVPLHPCTTQHNTTQHNTHLMNQHTVCHTYTHKTNHFTSYRFFQDTRSSTYINI
jgi:hypothetical protein